ncbi:MAG: NAD(P)-dependent alcohol dehydrogenase [Rhodanobacter sp.]|nr:MAG: NAD(P)-dependent alcohol dehydrogenase [Rhodanobacter sp.]TAN28555.1 MAG: NAD(P)-dependent alcohol dehydrogenase [Rhodanobacter sp.]
MLAIQVTKPGLNNLQLVERPIPEPRRGEVVMRVGAAALNYRDLEVIEGSYAIAYDVPLIPLSDAVGEIVAVSDEVRRVKIGDRVASTFWQGWIDGAFESADTTSSLGGPLDGVLAEYIRLSSEGVVRVPHHLSDEQAATLPCAAVTAWHALVTDGHLAAGDSVLVEGSGSVSLFALQFALLAGARVIATSSSKSKLERLLTLGAHATVNYAETPMWGQEVRQLTSNRGVDHVIDVGGPESFQQALQAVRPGGQISIIGYLGGKTGTINPLEIFQQQVTVRGTVRVGPRKSFEDMNRAIATNKMHPVVDKVFVWTEIRDALNYMRIQQNFGKIVLAF